MPATAARMYKNMDKMTSSDARISVPVPILFTGISSLFCSTPKRLTHTSAAYLNFDCIPDI